MDNIWAPLVPTTKDSTSIGLATVTNGRDNSSERARAACKINDVSLDPFSVGSLPSAVVQRILSFVPVSDLPSCALSARSVARFVADERLWAHKLECLQYKQIPERRIRYSPDLSTVAASNRKTKHDAQPSSRKDSASASVDLSKVSPCGTNGSMASVDTIDDDDDFGDFEGGSITGSVGDSSFGGFGSSKTSQNGQNFSSTPVFSYHAESKLPIPSTDTDSAYQTFKRIAIALKPFIQSLLFETSSTTSLIFTDSSLSSLSSQAYMVCNLARFTGPGVLGYFAKPHRVESTTSTALDASSEAYDQDQWRLRASIREAADYLEGMLLAAFEGADARRTDALRAGQRGMDVSKAVERAESDMHEHATLIWDLAVSSIDPSARGTFGSQTQVDSGEVTDFTALLDRPGSAAALSHLEKHDAHFKSISHLPDANFITSSPSSRPSLDFTAMDAFMADVLKMLQSQGSLIARVFQPEQHVLFAFANRIANEVVGDYINSVLSKARSVDTHLYLQAVAATFSQALKIADALENVKPLYPEHVTPAKCRGIVLGLFEAHLDEYLQEERDWVRSAMINICKNNSVSGNTNETIGKTGLPKNAGFLASNNPSQVKRNILTGFKHVLLMPVTIVPRAAGAVGGAVIRTAGTGLSHLNPLRWQQGSVAGARSMSGASTPQQSHTPGVAAENGTATDNGYIDFSKEVLGGPDEHVIGDDGNDDEVQDFMSRPNVNVGGFASLANTTGQDAWTSESHDVNRITWSGDADSWNATAKSSESLSLQSISVAEHDKDRSATTITSMEKDSSSAAAQDWNRFSRLQLLLSIDTALSLVQVNRESLKRMEAFMVFPSNSSNGRRVEEEMEEVCLSLFQVLGDQHIAPGFRKATEEIKSWNPLSESNPREASKTERASDGEGGAEVLPLVQFFELTHIADTISQLCSVYFSQTLVPVVKLDVDDFLNPVVRAKKSFEGTLDEFVAGGLSVSVDLLMKRAEWILFSQRDPLDYAGDSIASLDNSTRATRATIEVLRFHCSLLVGATDREILDIFYTEVALRLFGILTKHLKSLTISQTGGFQLISDLNHIAAFVSGLKSKEPDIPRFYNSLKTLANYYIVDGKELIALLKNKDAAATSARDSAREDGFVFGQEELYEFLKSRTDFRHIEKQVDHEIFGFKVSEDCIVC
ncbi:related to RCY1 - F-box protein involved in recycling plasma membrane proteins [Melanopsichium pennsylvanicum]|uniref:Related to RCY1 - F-box protein involved in recycling plasma membrane proteins n=2 Tax=Melanopsichium pennsylvanicum TaxID=63383 RepID=A0AAJ5C7B1_9BASI|nr:conserved hypothetical protein [Melanopsichium pennsylvanicum 4]SNX86324.1 related to RCY1 - F-box protein involved in recycling plasma membrane proteins [Melanopsichium pennsylvanicum]